MRKISAMYQWSGGTDWKPSYIACRAFNQVPPIIPVFEQGTGKAEEFPEGQMSLFDFMK